jgi:predicted enzyme related to lactoylglutathione lyase
MKSPIGSTGRLVCSLGVRDHKASAGWYIEKLGCSVEFQDDEMGMSFLKSPVENVFLDLSQMETPGVGGGATLVWSVADADAARRTLEGQGVTFDGPTRELGGMVRLDTFYDPDGNTLMLYQSLDK